MIYWSPPERLSGERNDAGVIRQSLPAIDHGLVWRARATGRRATGQLRVWYRSNEDHGDGTRYIVGLILMYVVLE